MNFSEDMLKQEESTAAIMDRMEELIDQAPKTKYFLVDTIGLEQKVRDGYLTKHRCEKCDGKSPCANACVSGYWYKHTEKSFIKFKENITGENNAQTHNVREIKEQEEGH